MNRFPGMAITVSSIFSGNCYDTSNKTNDANIIMLSIPDWGVMPFAADRDSQQIASETDAFNNVVREECSYAGVKYSDITDISRKASADDTMLAADGLYPSGEMYGLWIDGIYSHVYELLK